LLGAYEVFDNDAGEERLVFKAVVPFGGRLRRREGCRRYEGKGSQATYFDL